MVKSSELLLAIQAGNMDQVKQYLDEDSSLVNMKGGHEIPMVLMALYYQRPQIAELFAERGAVLDIFAASALGRLERVTELVNKNPKLVQATAGDGFHPLGLAAFFGKEAVVRYLIQKGAGVNDPSQNPMRIMPLHSATAGGHLETARALLEAGADPNARQADEFVPLHAAAQNGQVEMIELLLKFGADPNLANSEGKTGFDFARESGKPEAVGVLMSNSRK